jgi:hypothetical protein
MASEAISQVRQVLQSFQDGNVERDLSRLDEFVALFAPDEGIELIGIGASVRGGNEWFEGAEQIREIIESDWTYWGDVRIDVDGARINVRGKVAWLSTSGTLANTGEADKALPFYLEQMKGFLEDEDLSPQARLMDATHFGMRRLWERHKGLGHLWPFVFTAVLVETEEGWRFHQVQFAMPVD